METFSVLVMKKEEASGALVKEVGSYQIQAYGEYLQSVFVLERDNQDFAIVRLSTAQDVSDWEYSAIYDYYEPEKLRQVPGVSAAEEVEEDYNPVWEVSFPLPENSAQAEMILQNVLNAHHHHLQEVFEEIRDKETDYEDIQPPTSQTPRP